MTNRRRRVVSIHLQRLLLVLAWCAATASTYESCTYCPQYPTEEALRRFRDSIDNVYAGQEDAVAAISRVLTHNIVANSGNPSAAGGGGAVLKARPLLLHFTGPTGVGKTLMSTIVQNALFVTDCGVLKLQLDISYRLTSRDGKKERTDAMKRALVRQLDRCPRSLIIFDDFQFAPEIMILALREAFDEDYHAGYTLSHRDYRVSTRHAIFIFCSDLEGEQRHLSVDMTMAQARAKVSELAGEQWKNVDQSSSFGKLFVSGGMVPFVPLSESELRKVIRMEISKLTPRVERWLQFNANNHTVAHTWLGRVRWNEKRLDPAILALLGEDIEAYNARAVRNLVERTLLVHATDIAQCLLRESMSTAKKGWFYGWTIHLLNDIIVDDVDHGHRFTVMVGDSVCIGRRTSLGSSEGTQGAGNWANGEL